MSTLGSAKVSLTGNPSTIALLAKKPARLTPASRGRLLRLAEQPHEADVDVTGEVLEADVRQGRFQLWLDPKVSVNVQFSPEQEEMVTTALRDHRSTRLRIRGSAEFVPPGVGFQDLGTLAV